MSGPDARLLALRDSGLRPAVLMVDVQRSFADPAYLAGRLSDQAMSAVAAAVEAGGRLVGAARESGVPVVWVELGSDPERPWAASDWLRGRDPRAAMGPDYPCVIGTHGAEWFGMAPRDDEIVVRKRGYSGFLGTDLEARLRADGIGWLAVAGLTTECCVDATATDAFQLDFPVAVVVDATAAYDLDLHTSALTQLELNSAVLTTSSEVSEVWGSGGVRHR